LIKDYQNGTKLINQSATALVMFTMKKVF